MLWAVLGAIESHFPETLRGTSSGGSHTLNRLAATLVLNYDSRFCRYFSREGVSVSPFLESGPIKYSHKDNTGLLRLSDERQCSYHHIC